MSAVVVDVEVLVERVAQRVVELLVERGQTPAPGLVDAAELARILGISRSTVYDNAAKLGGVQVGNGGSRPRLRFDPVRAREAWTVDRPAEQHAAEGPSPAPVRRRPKSARTSGVKLLPVKRREAA